MNDGPAIHKDEETIFMPIIYLMLIADEKSAKYKDSYLDPEPFQHLQDKLNYWISHNHEVLAIGAFNARIGSQIDIDGDFL